MVDIPSSEPLGFVKGESVSWKISLADYPASDYELTYTLINSASKKEIVATADGDDYLVSITPTDSTNYTAGKYRFQAAVENDGGTVRKIVREGELQVFPDFAAETNYDYRTHARKVLDNIEAVLENTASQEQKSYTIEGRSLERREIAELLVLRDRYRAEVRAEELANKRKSGKYAGNKLHVRF